jgi:hypothetical protein
VKRLLAFVATGLLYAAPAEVVNQLYVRRSPHGFFSALLSYAILLTALFFIRKLFVRIFRRPLPSVTAWFVAFGAFGIWVEWVLLGNRGAAWYGQVAMFTFWAGLATVPVLSGENLVPPVLRKRTLRYFAVWYLIILASGLINPGLGLLLWVIGSCGLNYFFIRILLSLRKRSQRGPLPEATAS